MSEDKELVVVTGGAGFIGSHTVDILLDRGCCVAVLDNFSTGKRENLEHVRDHPCLDVVEANIVDGIWAALAPVVDKRGPVDRIVHLAAQTAVIFSMDNPVDDVRNNYTATVHVAEYARRAHVKKVVFASSAATYGDVATLPAEEGMHCDPISPYGIDKLASEMFLRYSATVLGVPTRCLRFFNVYGPRQDPASPYSGVISIFLSRAIRGEELGIFGDGEQTRDFVYVRDVAGAVVDAAFADGGAGEPINIGTATEVSINDLAQASIEVTGSGSGLRHLPPRAGEIIRSRADIGRAAQVLGYAPQWKIRDGLQRTAEWYRPVIEAGG